MSDLQKYIEKRKRTDPAFADGFDSSYTDLKMGILRQEQEQDDLRPEYDIAKLLKNRYVASTPK